MDNVVESLPYGKLRAIYTLGAADDTIVELQPAVGKIWRILDAAGWHDDTTSRTIYWGYYDGTNDLTKPIGSAVAAGIIVDLASGVGAAAGNPTVLGPIIATRSIYPRMWVAALTAGKKLTIWALVLEYNE